MPYHFKRGGTYLSSNELVRYVHDEGVKRNIPRLSKVNPDSVNAIAALVKSEGMPEPAAKFARLVLWLQDDVDGWIDAYANREINRAVQVTQALTPEQFQEFLRRAQDMRKDGDRKN